MNKTVWVTGGAVGIGAAIVRRLAADGWRVAFTYYRSEREAAVLKDELTASGRDVDCYRLEMGSFEETDRVLAQIKSRFGRVDALINNAGTASIGLFGDITEEEWNRVIRTDLTGTAACCRAVLADMVAQKHGRIVNISSVWGVVGASCEAAYSAAKAGVIGLTRALAKEAGPSGITVNAIAPGVIDTAMNSSFSKEDLDDLIVSTPLCRLGTPEDVAAATAFLLSENAGFITGQVLGVDGGFPS